ncbi:MAG: hypothetical protein R2810_01155 [Flavobacteriales bacterium]
MTGDGAARLLQLRWVDPQGIPLPRAKVTDAVGLEVSYEVLREGVRPSPWSSSTT